MSNYIVRSTLLERFAPRAADIFGHRARRRHDAARVKNRMRFLAANIARLQRGELTAREIAHLVATHGLPRRTAQAVKKRAVSGPPISERRRCLETYSANSLADVELGFGFG